MLKKLAKYSAIASMFVLMASLSYGAVLNTFMQNDDSVNIMKRFVTSSHYSIDSKSHPGNYSEEVWARETKNYLFLSKMTYAGNNLLAVELSVTPSGNNRNPRMDEMVRLVRGEYAKIEKVFGYSDTNQIKGMLDYARENRGEAGDRTDNIDIKIYSGDDNVTLTVTGRNDR